MADELPKIHIGQPYAVTGRKVLTRERCIISGHPAAERDLACHDNESEYRPWPQPLRSSRIRRQQASAALRQPICMSTAVRQRNKRSWSVISTTPAQTVSAGAVLRSMERGVKRRGFCTVRV